jgi:D-alanyl-D-alanine carboxypeptidase
METDEKPYSKPLVFSVLFIIFLLIAYCAYSFILLRNELAITKANLSITTTQCENQVIVMDQNTQSIQKDLSQANEDAKNLNDMLAVEQDKNAYFERQVNFIGKTVNTLEKLKATDKELLQKYSKIYFLSENYIPAKLSIIPQEYILDKTKTIKIHTEVLPFLEKMLVAASSSSSEIKIISGYRSFGDQTTLKENYKLSYGYGANRFSADQGYSEHQLGTTIDMTSSKLGVSFTKFDTDSAFAWMNENAYKYGFVISFPKQNTYYQYEPWHWRFVGINLATRLHDVNQYFYDLQQREIDQYLVSFFDAQ